MITVSDDENNMDRNVQGYCKEKRTPIESHQQLPIADQAPISLPLFTSGSTDRENLIAMWSF